MKQVKALIMQFFIQTKTDLADMKSEILQFRTSSKYMRGQMKENAHYYLFLLLMVFGLLQLYICICVTNGECLKEFLFRSSGEPLGDMFMDYFNPIRSLYMDNPYTQINAMYPPINYILLALFYKSIPEEKIIPDLSIDYLSLLEARNSFEAMFSYFSYCFIAILLLIGIINCFLKKNDVKLLFLFDIILLFSWGFLYTFYRGNFLLLPVAAIMFFFLVEDSKSKIVQEIGLVILSIAICMKVYPVFLSIYLLTRKQYSKFLRLGFYCVLFYFAPFALYGGAESIIANIKNMFIVSNNIDDLYTGGNISFRNSVYLFELITGKYSSVAGMLKNIGPVFIVLLGILSAFFVTKKWKVVALLTCIFLQVYSASMTYNLLFVVIPLVLFLAERNKSKLDYVYVVLFFFCMTPFPYVIYHVSQDFLLYSGCNITYGLMFVCIALNMMTFFLIMEGGGNLVKVLTDRRKSYRENNFQE